MKNIFLLLIFMVLFSTENIAQTKQEKAVAVAVETLRKAMIDGDRTALTNIAHDALTYGHSSGAMDDKVIFVEKIASGKSNFEKIDLTEQTIKVVGKTALVRFNFFAETKDSGKDPGTIKIHILTIWQKQGSSWKLLARQAVKIP